MSISLEFHFNVPQSKLSIQIDNLKRELVTKEEEISCLQVNNNHFSIESEKMRRLLEIGEESNVSHKSLI